MRLGVAVYSFKQAWTDAYGLMDRAADAGLAGVEFPADGCLPAATPEEMERARAYAASRGLGIVADGGIITEEALQRWLPQAKALGAPVLRVIVSGILGGNRRQMGGGWADYLAASRAALRATRPLAEDLDIAIAVENHQDIASDELLDLCEAVGGDHIGVTLDTGSTLALAEGPVTYTRRVRDYVKNIHIKDYRLHLSPTGYRLVTCGIGEGVIDFPALFGLFDDRPDLPANIELGARQARHVEMLDEDWWQDYPPRRPQDVLDALRLVFTHGRPADEDHRLPHERGAPAEELLAYELDELARSVAYLKRITGQPAALNS